MDKMINLAKLYYKNPNLITANLKWLFIKKWFLSKKLFVVQIGAGDGITSDPIRNLILKYDWDGILIEPQFRAYNKLSNSYNNKKGLFFLNCLISNIDGLVNFNVSKDSNLSSLKPDEWFKGRNKGESWDAFSSRMKLGHSKKVLTKSITFSTLIKAYNLKKIDLLVIDTEGYDFEIIKTIPFNKIDIDMIYYEHRHFSQNEKKEVVKFLKELGYKMINLEGDAFAILKWY